MTLQNGLIHNGKAYLWTDTLAYHPDHKTPLFHVTKTFHDISEKWVATFSGDTPGEFPHFVPQEIVNREAKTERQLIEACIAALKTLRLDHGLMQRVLLAFQCADNGARMFLIPGDDLGFAGAFEPFETIQFMSYGATFPGAPCDPETPGEMRRFIEWQKALPNASPYGGDLIQTEISMAGMKQRRWSDYFDTPEAQAA
ncbi:hypothetical protein EKJ_07020 [Qipengyuania flava]|uniref:Uncharacterized protein n=1 Tax=Qipengyuania flava TaxID=192812 RepID=A0A3T1CFV7_9SPHN|nr:hypothetical protein [Qipengyuania flava]BBI19855.1 hypothetical protein EKJ_07020 [Qipengyuania flava]